MDTLFLAFLAQHDDDAWHRVVDRLAQACHPVDRVAVRIWFHLFPMALQQAMDEAENPAKLAIRLRLDGRWRLADQIDTSHRFLYGHRHWPRVKTAVVTYATRAVAPSSLDLAAQIQEIARGISSDNGIRVDELVAITAIAVRTLQQVGLTAFSVPAPTGESSARGASADAVLASRARDDSQGLFGRFRGDRRRWTITFDEGEPDARFPLIHSQHLTTAAALDNRDHRGRDPRCSEGPIPVQCRSCSCGTCWVGVLGGAEKLSPMDDRERAKLASCGYIETSEERPIIRLACMAQAYGAVSIVIPPWNGQVGSVLKNRSISSSTGPR
jgi:ferredoxin